MILLVDNYDSFTFNLFQLLSELGANVEVRRNDAIEVADLKTRPPRGVVISPGPGTPDRAGVSLQIVSELAGTVPILGVCLGHQCIGHAYGGRVVIAPELMHGKSSEVYHSGEGVFRNVPNPISAVRYHSLTIDAESVPECLEVTARTADGTVMGLRHREHDVEGVQFHPESVMTPEGPHILRNWLERI